MIIITAIKTNVTGTKITDKGEWDFTKKKYINGRFDFTNVFKSINAHRFCVGV